jgi:rare lipoprotein A
MFFIRIIVILVTLAFFNSEPVNAQLLLGEIQTGKASYYASSLHGRKTAFGEKFQSTELSAAHRTYPLNTMLEVTNLANNEKVVVRVNDRGPYARSRVVDLSIEAAKILGIVTKGVANVAIRVVGMEGMVYLGKSEEADPSTGTIIPFIK